MPWNLGLTLKATYEFSHLLAMSVVRPGYATTHPPSSQLLRPPKSLPIGKWQERGRGGGDDATLLLTPISHLFLWASGGSHFTGA